MKAELSTYLNLVEDIKPIEQRRDPKTYTFLKTKKDRLVARGGGQGTVERRGLMCYVLTNSPNSIPPERCFSIMFSILNDTFDDDQTRSSADYIEYSIQSQYNARGRA